MSLADEIPELSKILAVADTYHAMTSNRPYRAALSSFEALKELRTLAGRTLDSRYVEVACRRAARQGPRLPGRHLDRLHGASTSAGASTLRLRGKALADLSEVRSASRRPSGRLASARARSAPRAPPSSIRTDERRHAGGDGCAGRRRAGCTASHERPSA